MSPTKLYMNGWINNKEYVIMTNHSTSMLRFHSALNTPIMVRIYSRMLKKYFFGIFRKILLG